MSDYLPDGMHACRYCGTAAPYFIGMDGEHYIEGQQHQRECPDAPPEECPF